MLVPVQRCAGDSGSKGFRNTDHRKGRDAELKHCQCVQHPRDSHATPAQPNPRPTPSRSRPVQLPRRRSGSRPTTTTPHPFISPVVPTLLELFSIRHSYLSPAPFLSSLSGLEPTGLQPSPHVHRAQLLSAGHLRCCEHNGCIGQDLYVLGFPNSLFTTRFSHRHHDGPVSWGVSSD